MFKSNATKSQEYSKEGRRHFNSGQYERAITAYTEALRLNPKDADAYNNRGCAKQNLGRTEEAIADYNEALRLNPGDAFVYRNRGSIKLDLKRYEEAIADYNEALRFDPDAGAYRNRGTAKWNLNRREEAIADYTEALRLNPKDADAYNNRGSIKDALSRYEDAIADYTEALRLNPKDADAYNSRGSAKDKLGRYEEAIADYTEALRFNPKDAFAYRKRGSAKDDLGRYEEAIADYTEALRLNPKDAVAYHNRGIVKKNLGRYEDAIADYNEALRLNPKDAAAYQNRGSAKDNLGRYEDAIADYTEALRLNPKSADAYQNRGVTKTNLGRTEDAIADYTEALRLNPKSAVVYNNRGIAKKNLGRYEDAIADYTEALRLNPKSAVAYQKNRGIAKKNLGRYEDAIADYNEALRLNPKDAAAYNNRGEVKKYLGRTEDAIADYNEALRFNPKSAVAYQNRGFVKSNLGHYEDAITDFNEALRLNRHLSYRYRGWAKAHQGKLQEAFQDYQQVVTKDSSVPVNHLLLGLHYGAGLGVHSNPMEAKNHLHQEQGILMTPQTKEDCKEFLIQAFHFEQRGDDYAQVVLGLIYQYGLLGEAVDKTKSISYFKKAEEQGNAYAKECLKELGVLEVTTKSPKTTLSTEMQLIPHQDLQYGRVLGEGGFGIVYAGTWNHGDVAIKKLKQQKINDEALEELQQEAKVMAQLSNPHVVQFYGFCFEPSNYALVMEYIPSGSLYDLLHSKQNMEWPMRIQLGVDVGAGLMYLHTKEILHRDLKSLNVLLDQKGTTYRGKLTDFGLAKIKTDSKLTSTKSGKGTLAWMAPELFARHAIFGKASDVYSYAVVLWEIASRAIPFGDAHDPSLIPTWVREGEREAIPKDTPPGMAALIGKCWAQRAEDRPSAGETVDALRATMNADSSSSSQATAPLFSYQGNLDSTF